MARPTPVAMSHALIASAELNDRALVPGLGEQALSDEQAEPRALPEEDRKTKVLIKLALQVLDGLETSQLDSALRALTRSRIPRDRR